MGGGSVSGTYVTDGQNGPDEGRGQKDRNAITNAKKGGDGHLPFASFLVGTSSFELLTPSVSRKCSTPELRAYFTARQLEFIHLPGGGVKFFLQRSYGTRDIFLPALARGAAPATGGTTGREQAAW